MTAGQGQTGRTSRQSYLINSRFTEGFSFFLNSDQAQAIVIDPKQPWTKLPDCIMNRDEISLASTPTVRNLGATFDQELTFNWHVKEGLSPHLIKVAQIGGNTDLE